MLGDDLVLAVEHLRVVELGVLAVDALFLGMYEVLPHVGRMQQRFRRDAAHVQAGAAQLGIFFDNGGLEAVLAGADRGGVAARTTPYHNQIVWHFIFQDSIGG